MEMPNLIDKIKEEVSKNIKRYPCNSNRASGLGYAMKELNGCLRRGVYERTHWQEKELWDIESYMRLNEGNNQERIVLQDLSKVGIDVIEQQTPYEWKEYQITGHVDGKIVVDGKAIPIEIKSMSPFIYAMVHSLEDFNKKPWLRSYLAQINLYMLMQNIDQAIFILKDKSSGNMKQINVSLDYELGEACLRAAEAINKHIKENTLPERINNLDTCKDCPFKMTCHPNKDFGVPLKIEDDPEFESKIDRCLELKEAEKEYKSLWKEITNKAKASSNDGNLNSMVGKYLLKAKPGKTFNLKIERI